jgi:hypothetical protein
MACDTSPLPSRSVAVWELPVVRRDKQHANRSLFQQAGEFSRSFANRGMNIENSVRWVKYPFSQVFDSPMVVT